MLNSVEAVSKYLWVVMMALQIKVPAIKLDFLTLIPGTHLVKGENQPLGCPLTSILHHDIHVPTHAHAHTHTK